MMQINRNSPAYKITIWGVLLVSVGLLWWLNTKVLSNPVYIKVDDFSHFWAAGRSLVSGTNPYDFHQIQSLKNQITGTDTNPDTVPIMWTPPWSLLFMLPFGWLDYPISRMIWLIACVAIVLVCSSVIWKHYSGPPKLLWLAWVIGFTFAPTISVLEKGQLTPIVLSGIIGFMVSIESKQNDWLAGIFTALVTIKPQLFFLFWPALGLWILNNKRWKLLISLLLTITIAGIPPLLFNPSLIQQYLHAFLLKTPTDWATPTLGGYLRLIFGIERTWLQFVPMGIGCIWFIYHYLRHKEKWIWSEQIPILLLVSLVFGGYGWTYDQVLSLVAVIPVIILVFTKPWGQKSTLIIGIYILINVLDLYLHRYLDEFWFGWLAPTILIWYWLTKRGSPTSVPQATI